MNSFAALAVIAGPTRCLAAAEGHGQPVLAAEAPSLPLAACTMPDECRCRFEKYPDRRRGDGDRRRSGSAQALFMHAGAERRRSPGRRSTDR